MRASCDVEARGVTGGGNDDGGSGRADLVCSGECEGVIGLFEDLCGTLGGGRIGGVLGRGVISSGD